MQLFQDQFWNIVSTVVGLLSVGVSVYIFILQSKAKKWRQLIISANQMAEVSNALALVANSFPGKITLTGSQIPIDDLSLVFLTIENTGNSPIEDQAFIGPMEVGFGESATIVSERITAVEPEALLSSIDYSLCRNSLLFAPFLLNQRDKLTIALLISSMSEIYVNMRIVGMAQEATDERLHISKSVVYRYMRQYLWPIASFFLLLGSWLLINSLLGVRNPLATHLILPLLTNTTFLSGFGWGIFLALVVGTVSRLLLFRRFRQSYESRYFGDQLQYVVSDR